MKSKITCLIIMAVLSSCALVNKVAVKATSNIIGEGSDELLTEGNWHFFDQAVPANLKLMEGLWYGDQGNEKLLELLIKGYSAYAFASMETKALKDLIEENDNSFHIDQTIITYEKAIFYGLQFLKLKGITESDFYDKTFSTKLAKIFDESFGKEDHIAIFYFAQALGSSINIQRQNIKKMAYLSHVKSMLKWVCAKDPSLERGSCGFFNAVIEASTPTLLGGSQAKARVNFKQVIKEQPYNLLARLSFIQYHIIPMVDEDEFSVEMEKLKRDLDNWYAYIKGDNGQKTLIYANHRHFNLFNSIAKEKYKILYKLRHEIF